VTIVSQMVLADERSTTPENVGGFLEAMEEARSPSMGGRIRKAASIHQSSGIENPIDFEGTGVSGLPEAQLDRFSLRFLINPGRQASSVMLDRQHYIPA